MNTWGIILLLLACRELSVTQRLRMWTVETGGLSSNLLSPCLHSGEPLNPLCLFSSFNLARNLRLQQSLL